MPELPEVQTVVNDLAFQIAGDTITGFWTAWPSAISLETKEKTAAAEKLASKIKNCKIIEIKRIGKYIVFTLNNDYSLLVHLRMTGQLLVQNYESRIMNQEKIPDKHVHHIFYLKKHSALFFHDVRKFGTITLLQTSHLQNFKGIVSLGLDPFSAQFTPAFLKKTLNLKEKRLIKELLLDQTLISGIGNIYASEILFASHILPSRKAGSLTAAEIKNLHTATRQILTKAIRLRGTSVSDYRDATGQKGGFQKVLQVYKKNGLPCQKCGTMIEKSVIAQRSTFFCPHCQK